MENKFLVTLCAIALAAAGCVTTPPPVIQGQDMAIEAVTKVEADVYQIIDAYNTEAKALVAEKYAKEFALTEAALLAEHNNDGTVDLARYKSYADKFATEIGNANAFYDNLAIQSKAQVGYKFGVAKNLSLAVQAYNKAAGIDPETFQQLLDATGSMASDVIDAYGAARVAKPSNPSQPDWKEVLKLAAQNKMGSLPNIGGDPNAAWRKWLETGTAPTLQDLVTSFIPKAREAVDSVLAPKPTPQADNPLSDTITVTPSTGTTIVIPQSDN